MNLRWCNDLMLRRLNKKCHGKVVLFSAHVWLFCFCHVKQFVFYTKGVLSRLRFQAPSNLFNWTLAESIEQIHFCLLIPASQYSLCQQELCVLKCLSNSGKTCQLHLVSLFKKQVKLLLISSLYHVSWWCYRDISTNLIDCRWMYVTTSA